MAIRRDNKLLVEPPSSATGDIAFNLIVFFLVCASVQPDSGRKQNLPAAEEVEEEQKQENIEVALARTAVFLNGDPLRVNQLAPRLKPLLDAKAKPEDKIVVVKSKPDTPYHHWIEVTAIVEDLGGIVTMQLEEERTVVVP